MTKSLLLKFAIGFLAGLSAAALFPRLIAELATAYENAYVDLPGQNYEEPVVLTPLTKTPASKPETGRLSRFFIKNVSATSKDLYRVADYGVAIRNSRRAHVVVLDQASSKEEAKAKAASLRDRLPVRIFKTDNTYLITTTDGPRNKSAALIEAVRIKMTKNLNPLIMQVK